MSRVQLSSEAEPENKSFLCLFGSKQINDKYSIFFLLERRKLRSNLLELGPELARIPIRLSHFFLLSSLEITTQQQNRKGSQGTAEADAENRAVGTIGKTL